MGETLAVGDKDVSGLLVGIAVIVGAWDGSLETDGSNVRVGRGLVLGNTLGCSDSVGNEDTEGASVAVGSIDGKLEIVGAALGRFVNVGLLLG